MTDAACSMLPPAEPVARDRPALHPDGNSDWTSPQSPPETVSKQGVGWRKPSMMIGFIFVALAHLGLFPYLDGKPADGEDRVAPQSYVTTASNIFSAAFALGRKCSIAVAFTQYLWHTLRSTTLKVSTIESLFGLRSNVFSLFNRYVLADGHILVLIAVMIWSIQIASSFPPGALTIGTILKTFNGTMNVPTYNASFFGNGSGYDAERYSLMGFTNFDEDTTYPSTDNDNLFHSNTFLQNYATNVLVKGGPTDMVSPCGANCSFKLNLAVPYLKCKTSFSVVDVFPGSEAYTNATTCGHLGDGNIVHIKVFDVHWDFFIFNVTAYLSDNTPESDKSPLANTTTANNTICSPGRANYTLRFNYTNNIQKMDVTIDSVASLNFNSVAAQAEPSNPDSMQSLPGQKGPVPFPGFMIIQPLATYYGTNALNWTSSLVDCEGMASSLSGTVAEGSFVVPASETVAANTRFNNDYGIHMREDPPTINNINSTALLASQNASESFNDVNYQVTPDKLNSALLNITLSAIVDFGWWNTINTPIMRQNPINVYNFSKRLNLIIPYFLSLLLTLPILALGAFALHKNGVSATDGGFTQLVTTTAGSETLSKVAVGGYLGGSEGVPKELDDLEVRFGELVGGEWKGGLRRTGFGTAEETVPLVKGEVYGR